MELRTLLEEIPANANFPKKQPPYGSFHYRFEEKTVPGQLRRRQNSEAEAARIVDEIREKYKSVLSKRMGIANLLNAFKRDSGARKDSEIPMCYRSILFHLQPEEDVRVLVIENPPQINIVSSCDNSSIQRAVGSFNTMMKNSHAFIKDTETVVKDIEKQLKRLEKNIGSMAVQMKHEECKRIPAEIEGCLEEVRCLMQDVVAAKDSFEESRSLASVSKMGQ